MKSITKIKISKSIILISVYISSILSLKIEDQMQKSPTKDFNLESSWKRLFSDPHPISSSYSSKKKDFNPKPPTIADGPQWRVPKKKPNTFVKKQIGWGPSAYLFDFLDDVIQKEILDEFIKIFTMANLIIPDPNYKDVYTLENILQLKGSEEELINKIKKLMINSQGESTFNEKSWKISITTAQINTIMTEWNWQVRYITNSPDTARAFVDEFDFNGDGRLSPEEFIIAMIISNKSIAGNGVCKNCMEEVIKNTIDPIYMYLDATNEEKVNAENIWTNLQKLKRPKPNAYNFFLCDFNGGSFRTSAVNDFIIKAKHSIDGYLTKTEFRLAVLQGYWNRHVDDLGINVNAEFSMKPLRWDSEGNVDTICEALKQNKKS